MNMERELKVVVKVSDEDHANQIRADIINVVKNRTPIYFIGNLHKPTDKSIEELKAFGEN